MTWLDTFRSGKARRRNLVGAGAAAIGIPTIEFDEEQRYRPIDWQLVRRLLGELTPFRFQYALGIVVGLVHVLLDLTGPFFIAHLIDYCTAYKRGSLGIAESQAIRHVLVIMAMWTGAFVF